MAEDNNEKEKKPKATLIKHRKGHSEQSDEQQGDHGKSSSSQEEKQEKKKVRVVLKRKSKGQEQKSAGETQAKSSSSETQTTSQEHASQPSTSTPSETGKAPQESAGAQASQEAGDRSSSQGRPSEGAQSTQPQAQSGGRSQSSQRAASDQQAPQGRQRSQGAQARQSTGQNRQSGGSQEQRSRSQESRSGSSRQTREGGSVREGGARQAREGSGRQTREGGGRGRQQSSAPPRGRGGGGGGAPQADQKRGGAKKTFKTRRRDQQRGGKKKEQPKEKEFQEQKKRQAPKPNPVPKEIDIMEVITVSELAKKMNLKASELISKLMSMGMMVTINQQIDAETAQILADEYGCKVNIVSLYDETVIETSEDKEEDLQARPPVVTVMGHVDHGKTKLLDAIRTTDVASGEFGGITQHIGAYQVKLPDGSHLTFVDTPGHSAFTMMRARGAQVTDIVILVVAADDGVMPQTKEAVSHAREAGVPIIVAINKTDLPGANPDRVKQELSELDLVPEEWGGNTLYTSISALKHEGIDSLLENLKLQAEVLELKANYNCEAEGRVIESKVDPGRGTVSTVLVQRGTLKIGDNFVAGVYPGRVRNMFNDKGERLEEAPPSTPVEILGLTGLPDAGDPFQVTENERTARQVGDKRQELKKVEEAQNVRKITLDNLYESIQEGEVQELKVIIKGDVQGSVEALEDALEKLSTSEVRLHPIQATAGAVNENDVRLASASNAIIIAFHVRATPRAQEMAEREKVEIRKYNVIYEVVDDIKSAMEGLLEPERHEEVVGTAEVRDVFKVPKIGLIAGCYVTSGKVRRNALVHVIRDDIEVYSGKISSLKRFKEDAREVEAGYECGIGVQNYNDVKVGDRLEIYEVREVERTLEQTEQHQQ